MRNRLHTRRSLALLTLTLLVAQITPISSAQEDEERDARRAINAYAITNARIVTVSGPVIERGTLVIRNGLISAVGGSASAPPDARLIDGTGLTVYPGLIDSSSSLGIPQQSPTPSRPSGSAGAAVTPPAAPQSQVAPSSALSNSTQPPGLRPEILAADLIQPGGEALGEARSVGLTATLTAPREGILIGQSAFINLAGSTPAKMIVRSPVALHVGFTPLRTGVYPASLMGVYAALRQMLLDATRLREANQIYERSPRGLRRPEQDRSLMALIPVITRQMPVVMYANTEREIRRALDLAEEFNLRAIISGGAQSWKVAARLRSKDVPVLLSLNFPKRMTASVPEADPEPLRVLRERVEAPGTAGRLANERVSFAFQSGAMTNMADFLTSVAKAVENGLAREEALRALTIRPAEILGVADRLGSIEVGKIANLTITRGELFDRNTRIHSVFIDGQPVELKPVAQASGAAAATTTTAAAGASASIDLSGTWTISFTLGERAESGTLNLRQQGASLSGTLQTSFGTTELSNGAAGADGFRFTTSANVEGRTVEMTLTGKASGNQMQGTITSEIGSVAFTGSRLP
ncbi:MAG TPA: amidohydrolase family protein [Pyrinomonadaceae bacterium]|jgi:imidazolonepropionase-like amidohydrolase